MTVEAHRETLSFQTEVKQLLHLMVHSLYSNKEIFLRELISNASDACDKLRFEALSDEALYEGETELAIEVEVDREARTVSVTDNGIGMSRQEVIDNIGTIARSGTRQFLEQLSGDTARDARLIGQFGVGFYSAFIVADRVTVETRRAGLGPEHGVRWTSDGQGSYTLENIERGRRGTTVTLHLREGEDEFLDPMRLRTIIRKYSDHISLPIRMRKPDSGEWEMVNRASALWARPRNEITDEEYIEFYKHLAHDFEPPLAWVHNQVEGSQAYTTLFYIPRHAPFDLYDRDKRYGIKLYVRRVFIMDDAEQLMPAYLRFVRGVVDSDDLPLNISREILQHNRQIDTIRAASVKRVLGLLERLAREEPDKYATFWKEFGRVLKEGPAEDPANRERIAGLLRFASTVDEDEAQRVSLAGYLERMKPEQEHIYYLIGESPAAVRHSPHLEVFRRKGVEVLLLWDRVDEWMMSFLTEYQGKPLVNIAKGELDLGKLEDAEEKQAAAEAEKQHADLIARLQQALGDRVKAVRISHRLTDSPACLVVESTDMAVSLHKLLRQAGHQVPEVMPTLEINPGHPLVQRMEAESDAARFQDWALLLFDQAMLAEGGQLDDPVGFVHRMNGLMLLVSQEAAGDRDTGGGGAGRTRRRKTAGGKKASGRRARKKDEEG